MPNGHGGSFRFGSALMLLVILGLLYAYFRKDGWAWLAYPGYILAAALGWRFAHSLHLWKVTEYDGAYTTGEAWTRAFVKYLVGSVVYAVAAMAVWYSIT